MSNTTINNDMHMIQSFEYLKFKAGEYGLATIDILSTDQSCYIILSVLLKHPSDDKINFGHFDGTIQNAINQNCYGNGSDETLQENFGLHCVQCLTKHVPSWLQYDESKSVRVDGRYIIIELKRAPEQKQVNEIVAWFADQYNTVIGN